MSPRRIVVTAGAAGIGRAIAKNFHAQGDLVAICDIDLSSVRDFESDFPGSIAMQADVSDESSLCRFLDRVENRWGGADVVCANAGTGGPAGPIESIEYGDWRNCLSVNLDGAFLTCRWAARVMKAQSSGLIVLTSSTAGNFGYPLRSPYASAKWAVTGLMKTLAMELGPHGIRVNAVCPGAVDGPRMDRVVAMEAAARSVDESVVRQNHVSNTSMKTWVSADDIANSVLFLSSPVGHKISGQTLSIDGNTETLRNG